MKRQTEEWIKKAEGDCKVALREMQTGEPVYETVVELVRKRLEKTRSVW